MDHGPAVEHEDDPASEYKTRLGVKLFIIYGIIYAGFVIINTFIPTFMETRIIFGLNLAVTYGFGLILLAIVLGLVYNSVCTKKEEELKNTGTDGGVS
ncbi:MAG: DUF485 domain-containing protein [Spirochaetales bacterium]|nr:DUF485 domain-containing protein [Spirochaetales bacterium]